MVFVTLIALSNTNGNGLFRHTRYTIYLTNQSSAMTESSHTAAVSVASSFKVESGAQIQTKKISTPPGRLTSFRTRDLTLSGALKKSKVCAEALVTHSSMIF